MEQDKKILVENWLSKAEEALIDAKDTIESGKYTNAQNRLYYAVFYAAMALGHNNDFITSKHSQLLGWFNKNFVKTGIVDKKFGYIYSKAFNNRMKSDYTITFKPDKDDLLQSFEDIKEFIEIIRVYINTNETN